jgi:hypothetical protein
MLGIWGEKVALESGGGWWIFSLKTRPVSAEFFWA